MINFDTDNHFALPMRKNAKWFITSGYFYCYWDFVKTTLAGLIVTCDQFCSFHRSQQEINNYDSKLLKVTLISFIIYKKTFAPGSRVLTLGVWVVDSQYWVVDSQHWVVDSQKWVVDD